MKAAVRRARVAVAFAGMLAVAVGAAAQAPPARPPSGPPPGAPPADTGDERPRPAAMDLLQLVVVDAAIETLPKQMKPFYKAHRQEMGSQSLDPEFPPRTPERRFLVDRLLPFPFSDLPRSEAALKAKYGERAEGIGRLPWLVQETYARLVAAMKANDKQKILAESDLLGAYVVDLHMVLNLTDNYDGQKTGQHGLFARLVDKLPQKMGRDLKASPDAARYLDNPNEYVFSMITATYVWLDNTLYLEDLARRGKPGYGDIYLEDLAKRVGPYLRERLSRAAEDVGSYWYTAWTVAGRPELK
jgi:hypothetical protein